MGARALTDAEIVAIAELLREGLTGSQIGARLGRTRNSIIGAVHRNAWLSQIGFSNPAPKMVATVKKRRMITKAMEKLALMSPEELRPQPPEPEPVPPVPADGVLFMELRSSQCKFPLWSSDPGISIFDKRCCGVATRGLVYCPEHTRVCASREHRRVA